MSQVLGLPDRSYRIGVCRETGLETARSGKSGNLLATRGSRAATDASGALDEKGSSWPVLRDGRGTELGAEHWGHVELIWETSSPDLNTEAAASY